MPNLDFKAIKLLSFPLSECTPGYGGSSGLRITKTRQICHGDTSNNSEWSFPNHLGTHIDFPYHFFAEGKSLSDYSPQTFWFSRVQFIHLPNLAAESLVKPKDIHSSLDPQMDFLLIRTDFERFRGTDQYWERNPGMSPELGQWLRINFPHLRAIGFDCISLTSYQNRELGRVAHRAFLSAEKEGQPILIVEDMHLSELEKAPQRLCVSPLMVEKADGSPVTVWALDE